MAIRGVGACLLAMALLTSGADAHGGLRSNKNLCVLRIGPDTMHFTGYQPFESRDEFCEDIPQVGPTVIVLDYVEPELRDMTAEIRIIKDVNRAGITGKAVELTDEELSSDHLAPITESYLPAKLYPNGTVNFEHFFAKAGNYIGIVTVRNSHGQYYISQFPFSVGQSYLKVLPYYIVLVGGVLGGLMVYWKCGRHYGASPPKNVG
jgi:hypothetical protein